MRSTYDDFPETQEDWLRALLSRILYILVGLALLILLICWFLPLIKDSQRQEHTLTTLQSQIDEQKSIYAVQSRKLKMLQNDKDYLEVMARDKLDLMKPGETIFRMEPLPEKKK